MADIPTLLQFIRIAPVSQETIEQAMRMDYPDFEDAVQMVCALQCGADCGDLDAGAGSTELSDRISVPGPSWIVFDRLFGARPYRSCSMRVRFPPICFPSRNVVPSGIRRSSPGEGPCDSSAEKRHIFQSPSSSFFILLQIEPLSKHLKVLRQGNTLPFRVVMHSASG